MVQAGRRAYFDMTGQVIVDEETGATRRYVGTMEVPKDLMVHDGTLPAFATALGKENGCRAVPVPGAPFVFDFV